MAKWIFYSSTLLTSRRLLKKVQLSFNKAYLRFLSHAKLINQLFLSIAVGGRGIAASWAGGLDGRVVIDRFLPLLEVDVVLSVNI